MIGENHGVNLNILNVVRVVTENSGQLNPPDLSQLLKGKRGWPPTILVPEPVSIPKVVELLAHDAGEGRANHGARKRFLRNTSRPQVYIFR